MHEALKQAAKDGRGLALSAEDTLEILGMLEEARRGQVADAVVVQRAQDAEAKIRELAHQLTLRLGSIKTLAEQASEHGLRPGDLDQIVRLATPPAQ